MEFTLYALVRAFLYSLLLGCAIAVLYEPIRIFHLCGFNGKLSYFFCDLFFMLFCGLITYLFSIAMLEGRVRFFVIFGETAGFCIFSLFLRKITDKIYLPVINLFKKTLKKLLKLCRKVMYNKLNSCNYGIRKIFSGLKRAALRVDIYGDRFKKRKHSRNKRRKNRRGKAEKEKV